MEKCHFQTNSDFLISMSNCLKHIDCNDVLMRYFLRFSCHSVQSVKHIDCNHVLMRYFLCFWYILFSILWMSVTQKASKPESPPTMLEVTIYNNIFRSRDSNSDCMMIYDQWSLIIQYPCHLFRTQKLRYDTGYLLTFEV